MEEKRVLLKSLILMILVSSFALDFTAAESRCRAQRRLLVNTCKRLLFRLSPTAECCRRLKVTPLNCICPIITPQVAALIDVNYAVGVIRRCGRNVPRHFKCGSLTTP